MVLWEQWTDLREKRTLESVRRGVEAEFEVALAAFLTDCGDVDAPGEVERLSFPLVLDGAEV